MKLKYIIALIVAGTAMIMVPAFFHRRFPRFVRAFFTEPGPPVNLAIFRVVLFATLLWFFPKHDPVYFGGLPRELLFPPPGTGWIARILPISPEIALLTYYPFMLAAFGAMIGWHTRWMAWLTVLLGVHVLGVPQLFGKINHYHHMIWFAAILAASPCGDVLSLDAILAAHRRAALPERPVQRSELAYALPLRFIWLLMGMIYFWAGTWKLWTEGWAWAFSDNLKFAMYEKWLQLGGWTPLIRIDRYDTLVHWMAAYTIVFEISFVFLILFRRLRALAVPLGLGFHNGTNMFMQISFVTFQICYVAFVNWSWVFHALGTRLFPRRSTLLYDGDCSFCRRAVVVIQELDLLGRVDYRNLRDSKQESGTDIVLESGGRRTAGFAAYRELALRIPVLWPVAPLLFVPPVAWAGRKIYRHVADHRACELASSSPDPRTPERSWRPAAVVGSFLVYVFVLSSIAKYHSWPFAGYPTFEDLLTRPEVTVLYLEADQADGTRVSSDVLLDRLLPDMSPERYHGMMARVTTTEDAGLRARRLQALWCTALRERPELASLRHVSFHLTLVSTRPEDWGKAPLSKKHLADLPRVACSGGRG